MDSQIKISDQLTVGAQPTEQGLRELAGKGFRSVMNLRATGEDEQPLSPDDEGKQVAELGLQYRNIPVSMKTMSPDTVDQFRQELAGLPGPVYVHCHKGKRAGAMAMMHAACEAGHTGEQTLQMADQMGFSCDQPELAGFVKTYVDSHGKI